MRNDSGSPDTAKAWRKTLLPADATLQHAIVSLDSSAMQIAVVVSSEGTLIGTVTDGDIRRGLLRGLDLASPVDSIIQRKPLVVPPEVDRDTALRIMQANFVRQLPIVDDQQRVVGLHLWNDIAASVELLNVMVIMAGGRGTRLLPYTEKCPKPMLPVGGKPMLEHIIERARAEGIQRVLLAVNYLGQMIEDYFGDGSRWQVKIDYLRESAPLGTAGAIGLITPRPDSPILVTNGDVLTDIRYREVLEFPVRHSAVATMAVRLHEWQHPFGVVRTNGVEIIGFEEKPIMRSHINAGIYVLDPAALDALPVGEPCDMPSLFVRLKDRMARTVVYPMHEPWLDVGRPDDYASAQQRQGPLS